MCVVFALMQQPSNAPWYSQGQLPPLGRIYNTPGTQCGAAPNPSFHSLMQASNVVVVLQVLLALPASTCSLAQARI